MPFSQPAVCGLFPYMLIDCSDYIISFFHAFFFFFFIFHYSYTIEKQTVGTDVAAD